MLEFLQRFGGVLSFELIRVGETVIRVSTIASVVLVVLGTFWVSRLLRLVATRAMHSRGAREGVIGTVTGLLHYVVLFTGFGIALSTAGIDLTALFAAGAFFAVALGFAMQSIAQNFVAGLILLVERAIKPGDVLEVEGKLLKVVEMGVRASIGQTRDGEDVIIPNSVLIQTSVKNYTLKDSVYRARVPVGVLYSSDMAEVRKHLEQVAVEMSAKWGVTGRAWQVIMTSFGDNAVQWELAVWISDPWDLRVAISDLHEAVWMRFKEAGIVIAFPQLDVHFDPPVTSALERVAGSRAA